MGAGARRFSAILLIAWVVALAGCASVWEQNFVPESSALAGAPAPLDPAFTAHDVRLRFVPWERVQAALAELNTHVAQSDVHPEEWPAETKNEVRSRLLRGLQITDDPSTIYVLGRSTFRTTDLIRPEGADAARLRTVGRTLGATTIVWSRSVLGETQTIIQQPVTTNTTTDVLGRGRGRRFGTTTYRESSTTWVPVTVSADQYGYVAVFLREIAPSGETSNNRQP